MSSLTNKLIGNIKKVSDDYNSSNYINSNNIVCIDTSNNRIGINTKNPEYSIHINGTNYNNAIKSYNLFIDNLADIKDVSAILIISNTISGDTILSNLIYSNFAYIDEISSNILNTKFIPNFTSSGEIIYNNLSGELINVQNLTAKNATVQDELNLQILSVDISSTIYKLSVTNNLTSLNANISNLLESQIAYINDLSSDTINVTDISLNQGNFNLLTGTSLSCNTINFINNLDINNKTLFEYININNINLGREISNNFTINSNEIYSNTIDSNDISSNNIMIKSSLYSETNSLIDISNSNFILPNLSNLNSNISNLNTINGSIVYDNSNNNLNVYGNNKWNSITFNNNFATIKYDNNDLLLSTVNSINYKHLSIKFDNVIGSILDISNSTTLIINNITDNSSNIYEINANISLQYINSITGDVEVNDYVFGLYPNYNDNNIINSINNNYVTTRNNIIAFDNIYNYANSSINYIGPLFKNNLYNNVNGFNFYIGSSKDIDNLTINTLNITVKLL